MKLLAESHSQSGQESFVLHMLNYKKKGYFLEIGAYDGIDLSNTYCLENVYGFKGLAIDINYRFAIRYNRKRSNPCIRRDATKINYRKLLVKHGFPKVIDYLQIDIEPAQNSLKCLKAIPFDDYNFRVITFEHDVYSSVENVGVKAEAFEILTRAGYTRIAEDVCNLGNPFEDWYVYKNLLPRQDIHELPSNVNFMNYFDNNFTD